MINSCDQLQFRLQVPNRDGRVVGLLCTGLAMDGDSISSFTNPSVAMIDVLEQLTRRDLGNSRPNVRKCFRPTFVYKIAPSFVGTTI